MNSFSNRFFKLFGLEKRISTNIKQDVGLYQDDLLDFLGSKHLLSIDKVSEDDAMKVPAVFNGVNFIAGTVAGLPFQAFEPSGNGAEVIKGYINRMLNRSWTPTMSSFLSRFALMTSVLLHGRGIIYIGRNPHNVPRQLFVLDQAKVQPHQSRPDYWYVNVPGLPNEVPDSDIIYIPFMVKTNSPLDAYGMLKKGARSINICLAIQDYLAGYFDSAASGNFAAEAPVSGKDAFNKFKKRIAEAVQFMKYNKSRVLTLPAGTNFTTISNDSRRSQLVENHIESVRQIARFFNLPPVVLGENSGTTWSLQDIDRFLSMHTIKRWKNTLEQQFALKLFPKFTDERFISLDLSELQRAMLKDRLESYRIAINSAQMTPNEARELEHRPEYEGEGGDKLYMQGATVPVDNVGQQNSEDSNNDESGEGDDIDEEGTDTDDNEENSNRIIEEIRTLDVASRNRILEYVASLDDISKNGK